jgi:uncharacterized protein (TIGR03067 family)
MKAVMSLFATTLGFLFLLAVTVRADEVEKELEKWQGDWVAVSGELAGLTCRAEELRAVKVTIQGDKWIGTGSGGTTTYSITLDLTTDPKRLDLKGVEGKWAGRLFLGIYKLEGDMLTVCKGHGDNSRPTEFATKVRTSHQLTVFKRVKP